MWEANDDVRVRKLINNKNRIYLLYFVFMAVFARWIFLFECMCLYSNVQHSSRMYVHNAVRVWLNSQINMNVYFIKKILEANDDLRIIRNKSICYRLECAINSQLTWKNLYSPLVFNCRYSKRSIRWLNKKEKQHRCTCAVHIAHNFFCILY